MFFTVTMVTVMGIATFFWSEFQLDSGLLAEAVLKKTIHREGGKLSRQILGFRK